MKNQSLMQFPCEFTIKVFGIACDEFEMEVISIVRKHVATLRENALTNRYSRDRKYLALSITFSATSQEALDSLYRELTASRHILMVL